MKPIPKIVERYSKLSRDQLLQRIAYLESLTPQSQLYQTTSTSSTKQRPLDFSLYHCHKIAIKFAYNGEGYHGLAIQSNDVPTIEGELLKVLENLKLIKDRESCAWSRCGRTDKGVSAYGQVVGVKVRGKRLEQEGYPEYMSMLNRALPEAIRILGWSPVGEEFNARYDCISRTYKYFIADVGLDIEKMRLGAQKLLGVHDFRHFCKFTVANQVAHFIREIKLFEIEEYNGGFWATIKGKGFLWHQVRCMMGVLFMIGGGFEEINVVDRLLDVESYKQKPCYEMASEIPLILYECEFDGIEWREEGNVDFSRMFRKSFCRSMMFKLFQLNRPIGKGLFLGVEMDISRFKPLEKRDLCQDYEEKRKKAR